MAYLTKRGNRKVNFKEQKNDRIKKPQDDEHILVQYIPCAVYTVLVPTK